MFKAKIVVEYKKDWSKDLMKKFNCLMKSLYCQNISEFKVIDVIKIKYEIRFIQSFEIFFKKYDYIDSVEILDKSEDYIVFQVITNCVTNNQKFVRNKCFEQSLIYINGQEHWTIITNSKNNLKKLIEDLNDGTRIAKLNSVTKFNFDRENLTDKQFTFLKFLYDNGYFEIPKKITLEQAAKLFSISKSNLNVHLNKSIKKIIGTFFDKNN